MIAAIPIGIVGGLAVGTAAGVAIERTTRPVQDPSVADMDAWEDALRDEFSDEIQTDRVTGARVDGEVDEYVRRNPPPGDTTASRTGGNWTFNRPEPDNRNGIGWAVAAASILGTIVATSAAVSSVPGHKDLAPIAGARGALRLAAPVAFASLGASMLVSSWIDRGR